MHVLRSLLPSRRVRLVCGLAALALTVGACNSDSAPTAPEPEDIVFDPSLDIDLSRMTQTALGTWIEDVVVGTGAEVQPGSQVTVEFTGWFPDGREFDSGVFSFVAGVGQVIVGFDDAVMNMRVGGVRKAVLPPQLAYGSRGTPDGTIPPNATLVFEIEVTDVQ